MSPLLLCAVVAVVVAHVTAQVTYDVTCTGKLMRVTLTSTGNNSSVYVQNLKGFPGCTPKTVEGKTVIKLPLDTFHDCGTTRMLNKYTGVTLYYNRIVVESTEGGKEVILTKCVLPGRMRRNILPDGFEEAEIYNVTSVVARAPTPYLSLAIRQNGRFLDTNTRVQPGTPLEMAVFLDAQSAPLYGLLVSYLKVTDGSPEHDEVIVMNGCSIDPYIFSNFGTTDGGKSLYSKFRAFKFPESNYVLFVGTVNVCLQQCRGVQCGSDQVGFGRRRRREIPASMPPDPAKLYEVEMSTAVRIEFEPGHFTPKREQVDRTFSGIQTKDPVAYHQTNQAFICLSRWTTILLTFLTSYIFIRQ